METIILEDLLEINRLCKETIALCEAHKPVDYFELAKTIVQKDMRTRGIETAGDNYLESINKDTARVAFSSGNGAVQTREF